MDKPIIRAIAVVGTQAELARRIKANPCAVSHWVTGRRPVPAKYCRAIERETGKAVTRHELCPDVFGPPRRRNSH